MSKCLCGAEAPCLRCMKPTEKMRRFRPEIYKDGAWMHQYPVGEYVRIDNPILLAMQEVCEAAFLWADEVSEETENVRYAVRKLRALLTDAPAEGEKVCVWTEYDEGYHTACGRWAFSVDPSLSCDCGLTVKIKLADDREGKED